MFRLTSLSIRSLLLLITFVVALPAAGIIVYSGIHFRKMAIEDARKETLKLADRIATEQRNLVVGAEQLMTALAQLPEVKGQDRDRVEPVLRELRKLNPMYSNILIADRSGAVWATAVPAPPPFIVADRRYFKNALASGRLSSGEYVVSRATAKSTFNLAYPLKDDRGVTIGVISVGFFIEKYRELLQQMRMPAGTSFVLIDHRGIILARGINPEPYIGKPYSPEAFLRMQEGPETQSRIRNGLTGDKRIISYSKLRLAGEPTPYMYVTAGIPTDVAIHDANEALIINVALLSVFLISGCSLAMLIGKRCIGDPIKLLEAASQRMAAGDLEGKVSDLVAGGELGSLGLRFDEMACQLRLREHALARSEQFLNTIIETEPECIKMLDARGNLQMMNRAGLDMIDADSLEQVQGQCMYPLVAPDHRDAFIQLTDDVFRGKTGTLVFETIGLKGRHIWLETHAVPFRNDLGEIVSLLSVTRDVSEQKKSAEERLENLLFIESLMEHSPMGIRVFAGESGQCILLNQAAAGIAGGEVEIMQGQNFRQLPSWRQSGLLDAAETVLADGVARVVEAEMETSFGRQVVVSYVVSRLLIKEKPHLLIVGRDVTDEKRIAEENKRIEAQMLHVQKLESLGVLAGGIAHDFNNILMAVLGNAELALMRLSAESPVRSNLKNIETSAQRAADLAQQMLAYSGKGNFVVQPLDVNAMITEMSHMLEVSISKKAIMRLNLSSDIPVVEADAMQLRQVIMNLVINASEAIGDSPGMIAIATGIMECDTSYLSEMWLNDKLPKGRYVYFEVADTGCGMGRETVAKIFDPFFTTKFTGRGLGMAAVLGIVRGHKGTIKVYSEPGKGTSFKVFLPARDSQPAATSGGSDSIQPAMGSGTILLVDDEQIILDLGAEMLETLGYGVLTAENGVVAVEIFQERKGDIACVILDLTMPELDGEQTFRSLRAIDPDVKVIMSSGYNEQDVSQKLVGRGLAGFMQKPYKLLELSQKLRQVLNGLTGPETGAGA